jgi:hypothetical protein
MSGSDGDAAVLAEFPDVYAVASADPPPIAIITPSGRQMTFGELGAAANQVASDVLARALEPATAAHRAVHPRRAWFRRPARRNRALGAA